MIMIDKIIKELCPDGVEYKTINEITKWDKRFNNIKNKNFAS